MVFMTWLLDSQLSEIRRHSELAGRQSTEAAFALRTLPRRVRVTAFLNFFQSRNLMSLRLMTAALLRDSGQCKKLNS